jgi:(4-(4-[2-(gamma-L-glutamylamino)ethyl]phenoxymethyl)furan-2-yl)methanamine synthase
MDETENPWVGLDIGGANLKAAHSAGWSGSCSFPMWKQPRALAKSIATLLDVCPAFQGVAITMTGELADCFATRAEGVAIILDQVTTVLPASIVRVYDVDGRWRTVSQAARDPWSVAASNWHALARWVACQNPVGRFLLIDIGSTTTDIVPIQDGTIAIEDRTDSQRLQSGALVYTGMERSNVAGLVRELPLFGGLCPVLNEQFATTMDVHLWLGTMKDQADRCDTADRMPATREQARFRLARLVGEDGSTLADSDIDALAQSVFESQVRLIEAGTAKMMRRFEDKKSLKKDHRVDKVRIVVSGHGDALIESIVGKLPSAVDRIRLSESLGESLSRCAPAYAIASLASRELPLGRTET